MENMDGPTNSTEATTPEVVALEPIQEVQLPAPTRPPTRITEAEAIAAGKGLGLKTIRIRRLARNAVIGRFMSQLGATHMGQGMLLVAQKEIEKGITLCDHYLRDYPHEPETIAAIMKVRLGLIQAMMKVAHTHIKVHKDSGAVELEMRPQNQAFPANAPININVVAQPTPKT